MSNWAINFFDYSYWQGDVNPNNIDDEYVLIRITVGATYQDPRFPQNYERAVDAGKKVIVYVVINPLYSAEAHWTNFIAHLDGREIVAVIFDVELSGGLSNTAVNLRVFETVNLFRQNFGEAKTKIIYTAKWFWDAHIGNVSWASEYVLHVAQYPGYPPNEDLPAGAVPTVIPSPWESADGWQWTDKGLFPEITYANIDRNVGNDNFVRALGGVIIHPPPPSIQLVTVYVMSAVKVRAGAGTNYAELDVLYPSPVDYPVYKEITGDNGVDKWVNISIRGQTAWCARIWKNPSTGVVYELMKFVPI